MSSGEEKVIVFESLEEEGLFSRDIDGQLVRFVEADKKDFDKEVRIVIDGQEITVRKAVPLTDSQGNVLHDEFGHAIPRLTTIYDAANEIYSKSEGSGLAGPPSGGRGAGDADSGGSSYDSPASGDMPGTCGFAIGQNPIPLLCHQPHMRPAAVCRVCSVEVWRYDPKKNAHQRSDKLVPACHHEVVENMVVHTVMSPDKDAARRVRQAVGPLIELLASDHLDTEDVRDDSLGDESDADYNVLTQLVRCWQNWSDERVEFDPHRFAFSKKPTPPPDHSSPLITVDHSACVLCDRCIRACNEVKQNFVISRSNKGYRTHISFDLNVPMGESTCVACGECMISCPTTALTFKPNREVQSQWAKDLIDSGNGEAVSGKRLRELHPFFHSIPHKFLEWNSSAAILRKVRAGEVLCRQGDHGSTAYMLLPGSQFAILDESRSTSGEADGGGWLSNLFSWLPGRDNPGRSTSSQDRTAAFLAHAPQKFQTFYEAALKDLTAKDEAAARNLDAKLCSMGRLIAVRTADDQIIGEMSCMSYQRRTATIVALCDCKIVEVRRNILYMLQRDPVARKMLDRAYQQRALETLLRSFDLVGPTNRGSDADPESLRREVSAYLKDKISLVRVDPGQVVFQQGDSVDDFFVLRVGYVKFIQRFNGRDIVLDYFRPGRHFGEIGLLAQMEELQDELGDRRLPAEIWGKRTATAIALDDVELVRIPGAAFMYLLQTYPPIRQKFIEYIQRLLAANEKKREMRPPSHLPEFLDQGVFNGQSLLIYDLEACTRCDECSRACAATHDNVSRLKRDGKRIGKYLVGSACRSCEDPYCLVGCPVDAIHRGRGQEIVIENHCIGCTLCEQNCPYGNIRMSVRKDHSPTATTAPLLAVTCDQCESVKGVRSKNDVSCVYACPHEAVFRWTGDQFLERLSWDEQRQS